jgi:hypothetical protein
MRRKSVNEESEESTRKAAPEKGAVFYTLENADYFINNYI